MTVERLLWSVTMPEPAYTPPANPTPLSDSTTSQRYLQRARRQTENGNFHEAIQSLERAMKSGADAYLCTLRIAELYRQMRQWKVALVRAEQAVQMAPDQVPAYEILIAVALELGAFPRAIQASYDLIKIAPRHISAHNALGTAYMQMGEIDAALRAVKTLIRLEPENAAHHFKRALLCQHKQEFALACYEFMVVLELEPEGSHAEQAREALNLLENCQLHQIVTLLAEDRLFRIRFQREPIEASKERGFLLTEAGFYALQNIGEQLLNDVPASPHYRHYN